MHAPCCTEPERSHCVLCRAVAKPDVQAHRLELSDDDNEDEMDVSGHQAAEGTSPPAAPEEPAEVGCCTDA